VAPLETGLRDMTGETEANLETPQAGWADSFCEYENELANATCATKFIIRVVSVSFSIVCVMRCNIV